MTDPNTPDSNHLDMPSSNESQHTDQSNNSTHLQNNETSQAQDKNPDNKQKNTRIKIVLAILLIALLGLIIFGLWKSYQPKTVSLQGRVEADTIHVSTKIPSRIEAIYVQEGQPIKQGQLLIKLSSPEIEAKKQQAQAALQSALAFQATAERGSQQENIETFYANWQSVKAQADLANKTYQRAANLYQQGVISRQRRDELHAAKISANQLAEAAYQQYARTKRGSTPEQKSTADAQVEIARAAVQEANALDAETILHSPIDGTISKIYGKPTELVAMAVPVVSILQNDHWVSLAVREDQYASVYQEKTLKGFIPALNKTVVFDIHNIEAEGDFATIKTTRQTGGYDIRSFKLHLTPHTPIADLKVGMSVIFQVKERN